MPQGARVWWVRTGLGAVLCLGTVGCMGTGKSPPPRIGSNGTTKPTTLPPPGLPGIQPISATSPAPGGTNPRPATPNTFTGGVGATGAVQPAGGFAANPVGAQPVARTVGQPVAPVGVPSAGPVPLPPTAPIGAGAGQLPPPSLDPPTAQRSFGATPPPPALDPIAPPPPPSPVVSGSNYSPIAPIAPPQPFPAPVPVNVAPSQGPQFGTP